MRKLIALTLLLCSPFLVHAATNITTMTVSGTWTLAGSPYNIFNNITVNAGQSLKIDPGVEIIFHGFYSLTVNGSIMSSGTNALPISYRVYDTSGWCNRNNVNGGWAGIKCESPDTLLFEYCNITNVKFTEDSGGYGFSVTNGKIRLKNCSFHNNSVQFDLFGSGHRLTAVFHFYNSTVNINSCKFYNNYSTIDILHIGEAVGAVSTTISNCLFYSNTVESLQDIGYVVNVQNYTTEFRNNAVFRNESSGGVFSSSNGRGQDVSVTGNKFYENASNDAVLTCFGGRTVISNNYVCNNRDDSSYCGITNGGGGIHIAGNNTPDTFSIIVRNNIIANNFSTLWAGGVYVSACNAEIVNNTIVNNNCPFGGAGIYAWESLGSSVGAALETNRLAIRNNIFYGNVIDGVGTTKDFKIVAQNKLYLEYCHNWVQKSFTNNIELLCANDTTLTYISDTAANYIGSNPGLINPTHTADVSESALTADFSLMASSQCINNGVIAPNIGYADYANNYRIFGATIDIGAYEYGSNPFPLGTPLTNPLRSSGILTYPNPASNLLFVITAEASGTLQLLDIAGKQVAEQKVTTTTTTFDINAVARGVYFATWTTAGGDIHVQRVVVQ